MSPFLVAAPVLGITGGKLRYEKAIQRKSDPSSYWEQWYGDPTQISRTSTPVVPVISQNEQNRQFSAATNPEETVGWATPRGTDRAKTQNGNSLVRFQVLLRRIAASLPLPQVLDTALAVYVTDPTLGNTGVGMQYGFIVGGNGVATSTFNVGANGAAFGVADETWSLP